MYISISIQKIHYNIYILCIWHETRYLPSKYGEFLCLSPRINSREWISIFVICDHLRICHPQFPWWGRLRMLKFWNHKSSQQYAPNQSCCKIVLIVCNVYIYIYNYIDSISILTLSSILCSWPESFSVISDITMMMMIIIIIIVIVMVIVIVITSIIMVSMCILSINDMVIHKLEYIYIYITHIYIYYVISHIYVYMAYPLQPAPRARSASSLNFLRWAQYLETRCVDRAPFV